MRNLYKCDICGKLIKGEGDKNLPKDFYAYEGNDFCSICYKQYRKIISDSLKKLIDKKINSAKLE